ncbi:MAG: hypothetical protein C0605_07760 [Hyphomicrobiales bacterium]|nr:MAG: hypothetical protein C0605_07760 [Hyphomicrobiales bacterium]
MTKPHPKSLFDIATELEEAQGLLHELICAFDAIYLKDEYRSLAAELEEGIWRASKALKANVADVYAAAFAEKGEAA